MTTRRVQQCPVDNWPLDDHTNEQMIECDLEARVRDLHGIYDPATKLPDLHQSWSYRLPERYRV